MEYTTQWEKGVIKCECGSAVFTGSDYSVDGFVGIKLVCKSCGKELTVENDGSIDLELNPPKPLNWVNIDPERLKKLLN